jgi:hypothetical protein
VKERRKDEERIEKMTKTKKKHTRPFLFLFFSGALLGHDACVWSVVNTSHTHTHTPHHTTPILPEKALSWNTPRLCMAPRYPGIGIRVQDTRIHNAYNRTASLFLSYSLFALLGEKHS